MRARALGLGLTIVVDPRQWRRHATCACAAGVRGRVVSGSSSPASARSRSKFIPGATRK